MVYFEHPEVHGRPLYLNAKANNNDGLVRVYYIPGTSLDLEIK